MKRLRPRAVLAGVLGFDCRTLRMDRERFNARTSIERRVVRQASGPLSGSAVALDALADVEMLADCEAHVLVLRSAVSRPAPACNKAKFSPGFAFHFCRDRLALPFTGFHEGRSD